MEAVIKEIMGLVNTVQKNRVCAEMCPSSKDHFNGLAQEASTTIVAHLRDALQCKGCAVKEGTHAPSGALHQIAEPAAPGAGHQFFDIGYTDALRITRVEGGPIFCELAAAPQAVQPAVPMDMRLVPAEFVRGFGDLAHNYSLAAVAPDHYHGVERDAFSAAYKRCGNDLAKLREILTAAPAHPAEGVPAPMPVAHPHHCTARTADGSCEECEGHAQAMAEWDAERAAFAATQPAPAIFGDEDHVLVPLGLIGAACYAIDKKRDATKTLAELRRYTTGDLSAATQPAAQGMDAQLVAFIEKVRDFKAQAVRVGSSEGQIRWDIEYGHYGDEVSAKKLPVAITKAIAAQAKQGGA